MQLCTFVVEILQLLRADSEILYVCSVHQSGDNYHRNSQCGSTRLHVLPTFRDTGEPKSSLRVGFATYDHTIHFYNLKSAMGQPQMLVVGDITDVFVPLVDGFLVTVDEAETAIQRCAASFFSIIAPC